MQHLRLVDGAERNVLPLHDVWEHETWRPSHVTKTFAPAEGRPPVLSVPLKWIFVFPIRSRTISLAPAVVESKPNRSFWGRLRGS